MEQLSNSFYNQLHIVLGVVEDKNLDAILPLFPKDAIYYFCKPNILRGLSVDELQKQALKYNLRGESYSTVSEAYKNAMSAAKSKDLIYIGGSTFVVAEVL